MGTSVKPFEFPIWPGAAPGSEDWTQREQAGVVSPDMKVVRNVARPTLTAYLPDPAVATGTAVVVCPGGAFHFLAIEHEGTDVAGWLVERGIAAFLLRYRVLPTAVDDAAFDRQFRANMADRDVLWSRTREAREMGVADGQQAIRVVRRRAAEWGVTPNRIGVMGFSAGGYVTLGVATGYDAESRPDFAAPIYAAPYESAIPADAPPLFVALASDDDMAVRGSVPLYQAWREAGHPVELHVFARGGHGFGMRRKGLPSDRWIELFGAWLAGEGFGPAD